MEKLDLVDKKDHIIGTTDKIEAHQTGKIHRVVAVFVFDSLRRIYLQEHLLSGGLYDHSVGGHVSKGEDYDHAALRETEEEIGLQQPLSFVTKVLSDEAQRGNKIAHWFAIYEVVADDDWVFKPNDEVQNLVPIPLDEVSQMMKDSPERFTPGFLSTMRAYLVAKEQ